jgi:hypothetical protein
VPVALARVTNAGSAVPAAGMGRGSNNNWVTERVFCSAACRAELPMKKDDNNAIALILRVTASMDIQDFPG